METSVVTKELSIIGKELQTNNSRLPELVKFWEKFQEEKTLREIPHKLDEHTIIALYTNYASDHTGDYSFILGAPVCSIKRVPSQMIGISTPKTQFAKITARGPIPESIQKAWSYIWSDAFPYIRAYTYDFELYEPHKLNQTIPEVDIYISIVNGNLE